MKTSFHWDPVEDNIVRELDGGGATVADYPTESGLYGNIISQNRGGVESQFHYDAQGSTLAVTDDNQNVAVAFAYTAFGEVTERTGTTAVPFQYIGRKGYYTDSVTAQVMVRRRPYEPTRARWLAADPSPHFGTIADYLYSGSSPTALFDPSGRWPLRCGDDGDSDLERAVDELEDLNDIKEIIKTLTEGSGLDKPSAPDVVDDTIVSKGTDIVISIIVALDKVKPTTICGKWFQSALRALTCARLNCSNTLCGGIANMNHPSLLPKCIEELTKGKPGFAALDIETGLKALATQMGDACKAAAFNSVPCCISGRRQRDRAGRCGRATGC